MACSRFGYRVKPSAIINPPFPKNTKRRLKPFSDDVLTILLPYNRVAAKAHK